MVERKLQRGITYTPSSRDLDSSREYQGVLNAVLEERTLVNVKAKSVPAYQVAQGTRDGGDCRKALWNGSLFRHIPNDE